MTTIADGTGLPAHRRARVWVKAVSWIASIGDPWARNHAGNGVVVSWFGVVHAWCGGMRCLPVPGGFGAR
jgi:hypothetical protein